MITQDRLKKLLVYDNDKGRFFWIEKTGRGKKASKNGEAGSVDAHGYGQVRIDGKIYKEHRLVWFYVYGVWPLEQIDHINHNRRDNRIENLREVNCVENGKNRPIQRNNKTGCQGVWKNPKDGKYEVYITHNGSRKNLGRFSDFNDAVQARKDAESRFLFHENHGIGNARSKHIPKRFKSHEDYQAYRSEQRRKKKAREFLSISDL